MMPSQTVPRANPFAAEPAARQEGVAVLGRSAFEAAVERSLRDASERGYTAGIVMIEVNGIGRINRALGHRAGDAVVEDVVHHLRHSVGPDVVLGRFVHGSFVALLGRISGAAQAIRIANGMVETVRTPRISGGLRVQLSASVGVSVVSPEAECAEKLLRNAAAATHAAKQRGPNHVELFRAEARPHTVRRLQLEAELCSALDDDELEIHFQPIVSVGPSEPPAIEALLRWRHPEQGLILAEQFIPIAEESGLIMEIGDWMLAEVCSRIAAWTEQDPSAACPPVAINVSARQLTDGTLDKRLSAALLATGVSPTQIVVEVTESSAMELQRGPLEALETLKRLGVKVMLDDFGTGYSSLAWLARLPIDGVKIDRTFVNGISALTDPAPILSAVVDMGRALGLSIIAEGVETADQLATVKAVGVDAVQGFFVARPSPVATLEDLRALIAAGRLMMTEVAAADEANATGDEMVGLNQAAELISVSASTMRRLADQGALPVRKTAGGHRRFRRKDLQRLARQRIGDPLLRPHELPGAPFPRITKLLRKRGQALIDATVRVMYERGRAGWFATPQGRTRTGMWLDSFAETLSRAHYPEAVEATTSYLALAVQGGASTAECVRFLSEFGRVTGREALRTGADNREDVRGLQRLVAAATESFLEQLDR